MESENSDVVDEAHKPSNGEDEQLQSEVSKKLEAAEDWKDDNYGIKDSESKLISLISQLPSLDYIKDLAKILSLIIQIISLVRSMDLESLPKPETKLISLISQTASLFNSMDFDSLPEPLSELISFLSQRLSINSDQKFTNSLWVRWKFKELVDKTLKLDPDPELISLICQIVSIVISMNSESKTLISLCPQVQVSFNEGKFEGIGEASGNRIHKRNCLLGKPRKFPLTIQGATHFHCKGCNGKYHKEYEKAPLEIKHPLHPKHSLQLVLTWDFGTRECYCCDEDLQEVFYYCSACDYAMNIACVEKPRLLARDHPKWHDHTLALFPSQTSIRCNVCALTHSNCPLYICPPCDFVVHQKCISLPRLIRISRHPHRISFTPSFDQGDWSCDVCRRKINNDYGGYSCIKNSCSYAVHSKCATQENVWDGINLEGEPEDIEEEELEPFVSISDGIIQHFKHEDHHLRLDENADREYDENKLCQACITPIYFGNLYSCVQCEFFLHERCANLSRKIYHPIHPHMLTLSLVGENNYVLIRDACSACPRSLTAGFFYNCGKEECDFRVHVQCAQISEPLVHESHDHSLFLTSKPGEERQCHVCQSSTVETFNCIECNDFALCFKCATLPPKVRYKHDKHILTLSYGDEKSTMKYWCEACERKIDLKKQFYRCDEYCCVTLHIECLIGRDVYMKPGSSFFLYGDKKTDVLSNNHHMSRPICSKCEKRCSQRIVFQANHGSVFCSKGCAASSFLIKRST